MNKKMRELAAKIKAKLAEARTYQDGETKDIDKAAAIMAEVKELEKEFDTEKEAYELEKKLNAPSVEDLDELKNRANPLEVNPQTDEEKKTYKTAFLNAMKDSDLSTLPADFSEGVKEDGGYTVPEDIDYKVRTLREAKASLLNLVTVETTNTLSGRRTYKKRSEQTGFVKVGEKGKIPAKATPKFSILEYTIEKYAGYFVATDEVLEDSVENLEGILAQWMADESRVTANKLILGELDKLPKATLTDGTVIDDIKKILNVTLGQAFKPTSVIVTNDDGLQYLDTLKDKDGKYLLSASPADPMKQVLAAGATTVPVHVIPNGDLPTAGGAIPFYIGDLKEAVTFIDRKKRTMVVSNTAAIGEINAFEQDLTIFRCIERETVVTKDEKAAVKATLTITPKTENGAD